MKINYKANKNADFFAKKRCSFSCCKLQLLKKKKEYIKYLSTAWSLQMIDRKDEKILAWRNLMWVRTRWWMTLQRRKISLQLQRRHGTRKHISNGKITWLGSRKLLWKNGPVGNGIRGPIHTGEPTADDKFSSSLWTKFIGNTFDNERF